MKPLKSIHSLLWIKTIDRVVFLITALVLLYSSFLLRDAYQSGTHLGEWIWDRHQNLFSWYSRPLFLVPAAYYAYRRKLWYVIAMIMLMFASLFWFEAPSEISPNVSNYLAWEKRLFFSKDNVIPLASLVVAASLFLGLFFLAFWRRSYWYGLFVMNLGTFIKIGVSVGLGGEDGHAAVVPSLSSLLIIDLLAIALWHWRSGPLRH